MRVNFELTTTDKTDVKILSVFGKFLSEDLENVCGVDKKDDVVEESVAETPAEPAEEVEKPKAKRTRKKKEEQVAEPVVEPAEQVVEPVEVEEPTAEEKDAAMEKEPEAEQTAPEPAEEPTEDQVEVKFAPMVNKCTVEEWREVFKQKLCELGICKMVKSGKNTDIVEGPRAEIKPLFNDYVHKMSEMHGNRIPSKLDGETLYGFVEQFKRVAYNSETKEFFIDGAPF